MPVNVCEPDMHTRLGFRFASRDTRDCSRESHDTEPESDVETPTMEMDPCEKKLCESCCSALPAAAASALQTTLILVGCTAVFGVVSVATLMYEPDDTSPSAASAMWAGLTWGGVAFAARLFVISPLAALLGTRCVYKLAGMSHDHAARCDLED